MSERDGLGRDVAAGEPTEPPRRIAVTGASGSLGRRVVARLAAERSTEQIVALDREPFPEPPPKVAFARCDVRDAEIRRRLEGCDVLVHLAFVVERGRDDRETAEINVGGSRNVFQAAARAGVHRIVYASSVAAYGFHADTDGVVLDESAAIRGNDEFYYGRHKASVESWLDGFEAAHPEIRVARLRPSVFLGEDSRRDVRALRRPFHPVLSGPSPRLQIAHEDDVAAAFVLAVKRGARGAFNLASEEPLTLREMGAAMGKPCIPVPRALLTLYRLAFRLGWGDVDPVWIDVAAGRSLLVSSRRARRELGWQPRYRTTADVLRRIAGRADT